MVALTEIALIAEMLKWLFGLIKDITSVSKKAKERLVKVHRENLRNRNALKQLGCLKMTGISVDDKTFISVVTPFLHNGAYMCAMPCCIIPETQLNAAPLSGIPHIF